MCGIYGQIRFRGTPDPDACRRRLSLLAHRGPDHRGEFFQGPAFLGHARLSVLDPEPVAHQPFGNGTHRLVYNGEVYNFGALKKSLPGANWKTRSDTEVLFELLSARGDACLPELDGMFAFAWWDEGKGALLLARDRAGIKPLYYRADADGVEFASEIKAFEARPERLESLKEVIARGHVGEAPLPFTGIRELEPGTCLRVDARAGTVEIRAFVSLPRLVAPERMAALEARGLASLSEELGRDLSASVEAHLQSDAPVGALCSGGLDSTFVSALALRHRPDMRLYHCGVKGPGGEEAHARAAARHLSAELIVERLGPEEFLGSLPEITWHLDLPAYHPNDMGLHLIARRAHRDGIKVLLCGEGADELFGGYSWQRDLVRLARGRARLAGRGGTAERAWSRLRRLWNLWLGNPAFTPGETIRFAAGGLCYPPPGHERIYKGHSLFSEDFRAWARWDACLEPYAHLPAPEGAAQALMLENIHGHLRTILHRTDRILMAHSIEGRVPFLQNNLIAFGLNLPLHAKIRGRAGKVALKHAARRVLPSSIVDRPKEGFPVPWTDWIPRRPVLIEDGFLAEWTRLTASQLHAFHEGDPVLRFRLIALEVWGRIFVHGEAPAGIRVR